MIDLIKCPYCHGERLPNEEQPEPSLHACTVLYKCGTEIVIPIVMDAWDFITEKQCDDNHS